MLANGDTTGYSYHGDFLNGWDQAVQDNAVQNCLASAGSGQIDDCPILKANNDPRSGNNCPQQLALVDEKVSGVLSALPGCNTPSAGSASVSGKVCPGTLITPNTVTDGQTRQVPTVEKTVVAFGSSSATYKGCYVESTGARALVGASYADSSNMTNQNCGTFCLSKGFSVFGTEYAGECYCGNTIATANSTQSDCSMACNGDVLSYCGGPNRLSVWTIANAVSSTSSAVTTTTTTAAAGPTVSGAKYLGCYTDSVSSRALSGYYSNNGGQTLDTCAAAAVANNYRYFGVEYGAECFAGNTIAASSASSGATCGMKCGGNGTQICGGSNAVSMFENSAFVAAANKQSVSVSNAGATASYKYVGCYTDAGGNRRTLANYSFSDAKMTAELCAATCFSKGFSWAGTEYANECYCGSSGISNGATVAPGGDSDCSMRCAGDKTEWCGAGSRLTVYQKAT